MKKAAKEEGRKEKYKHHRCQKGSARYHRPVIDKLAVYKQMIPIRGEKKIDIKLSNIQDRKISK